MGEVKFREHSLRLKSKTEVWSRPNLRPNADLKFGLSPKHKSTRIFRSRLKQSRLKAV